MGWLEQTAQRTRTSKLWRDEADPTRFALDAAIGALHYESVLDSGVYDAEIDCTPQRVDTAQFDGWRITANGWHYALGIDQTNHPGEDGWFGFGGRQGANWFKFRLERVGYIRWTNKAWTDLGGLPTYNRANLTQTTDTLPLPDGSTQVIAAGAEWRNLYTTPGGGEMWLEIQTDGDRLKVNPVINQAGRAYVATQYPGTPVAQTYFSFAFRLDVADIPKWFKAGIQQDPSGDFDDGDGTLPILAQDALERLLFLLPVDYAIVRDATGNPLERLKLRKRIYQDGGNIWLLVGARVDLLNALPAGDLVFDPTITPQVGASGDDGYINDGGGGQITVAGTTANTGWNRFQGLCHSWWRFTSISGLSGVTIDTSYLTVYVNTVGTASVLSKIYCDDAAAPTAPTTYAEYTGKTTTTAGADQDGAFGGTGFQNTVSLNGPLQEIVDSYDPSAIQLLWKDDGTTQDPDNHHAYTFRTYDWTQAATLHVEYTESGGGAQTINANAIAAAATVYQPSVTPGAITVSVNAIASAAAVYQPAVTPGAVTISPNVIASGTQVFAPAVTLGALTISANAIASTAQVNAPALTFGAVTVTLETIASAATVAQPAVTFGAITITLVAVESTATVAQPAITFGAITVSLDAIDSAATVFQPAVTLGGLVVQANAIGSTATVYEPALSFGAITISANAIASGSQVYAPSVETGVVVYPDAIAAGSQVYQPALTFGAVTIGAAAIESAAQVAQPALTFGAITVSVNAIASAAQVYEPAVSVGGTIVQANTIVSAAEVFAPSLTFGAITVAVEVVASVAVVYAPTVQPGSVTVSVNAIGSVAAVFAPVVTIGAASILPAVIDSTAQVYEPSLTFGAITVSPDVVASAATVYQPVVMVGLTQTITPNVIGSTSVVYAILAVVQLAASRTFAVGADGRSMTVAADGRAMTVAAASRIYTVEA